MPQMGGAALASFLFPIIVPSLSSSKRLCCVVLPVAYCPLPLSCRPSPLSCRVVMPPVAIVVPPVVVVVPRRRSACRRHRAACSPAAPCRRPVARRRRRAAHRRRRAACRPAAPCRRPAARRRCRAAWVGCYEATTDFGSRFVRNSPSDTNITIIATVISNAS